MTVVWHVDELKVFHKDLFEVTKFYQYLSTIYGNKLKLHRVKIHDWLVMDLDYSDTGVVNISMIKYLQKVLDGFPEDFRGTFATLEEDRLFQLIGEDEAEFLE